MFKVDLGVLRASIGNVVHSKNSEHVNILYLPQSRKRSIGKSSKCYASQLEHLISSGDQSTKMVCGWSALQPLGFAKMAGIPL